MSGIKLPIQAGQKFLCNGAPGKIISTTIDDGPYTVAWLADDGSLVSYFTADGGCLAGSRKHLCDLQPIPAVIAEGVEFSGPEYREEFERLESEGRKFEIFLGGAFRSFRSGAGFCDDDVYVLLPVQQHLDENGHPLKVGDRVECLGSRDTITGFAGDIATFKTGIPWSCNQCRKLTTKTRPLCADDLDKAPCPLLKMHDVEESRVYPDWDEKGVYPYAGGELLTWLDLQESDHQWRPSSDQPWQPCEVEEEVLA